MTVAELIVTAPEAPSPFRPDTVAQFAWDSVSIGNALACWRRYQYTVIEGWRSKSPNAAIALTFGIAFHHGLEYYHRARADGCDHDWAVHIAIRKLTASAEYAALPTSDEIAVMRETVEEDDDGITLRNSKVRTRYHLIRAVTWYLDHYENDPLTTILHADGTAAVEVSFRIPMPLLQPNGEPYILAGHLDRVAEMVGRPYVVDYKTTKSLSSQFFSTFALSHQMSGYTFAGQVALSQPIAGVIIDGIALQVGGCKFGRAPAPRTRGQLGEFFDQCEHTFAIAEGLAAKLIADPRFEYPMNTQSCYFCDFKEICSQPPEFRRRYLAMHFERKPAWNPLENR
jgi:hypothetical protein